MVWFAGRANLTFDILHERFSLSVQSILQDEQAFWRMLIICLKWPIKLICKQLPFPPIFLYFREINKNYRIFS